MNAAGGRPARFKVIWAAPLLLVMFALVGCTAQASVASFRSVHAKLDYQNGTIAMPLDAYVLSSPEVHVVEHANAVLMASCMAKSGQQYPAANLNWEGLPAAENRTYGIFNLAEAKQYGYFPPADSSFTAEQKLEESFPESWGEATDNCARQVKQIPLHALGSTTTPSAADVAQRETYQSAIADSRWRSAFNDWKKCVAAFGIKPDGDTGAGPVLPHDPQAQIQVAVHDVECRSKTNFTQRVADVHAQYQAAYIASHASELQAERKIARSDLARAQQIIDTNGK